MTFLYPRRFSECWQASADLPGTLDQQRATRDALLLEFGSNRHRLMQKIDRRINQSGHSYLPIIFTDTPPDYLAHGGASGVVMSKLLHPLWLGDLLVHEIGHVYEQLDLLTQSQKFLYMEMISPTDRDWRHFSESFADSFRDWFKGTGWSSLTPILLAE